MTNKNTAILCLSMTLAACVPPSEVTTPQSTPSDPSVSGVARYLDSNLNHIVDAGDQLIVPLDQAVTVDSATADDFSLPVTGDSLGTSATAAAGPAINEVTITLGASPSLSIRSDYNGTTTAGASSAVDVSNLMVSGHIVSASGVDAEPSTPVDMIPAFVDSLQLLGSNNTTAIALADLDADGDADMAVANDGQANRVYLNDGSGVFSDSGQALGINNSSGIALGDLDADGDTDMAVANNGAANNVYLNDGSGTFTDSAQALGTNNSTAIALADIDGDFDVDLVVANNSAANLVYLNDGSGTFTDSEQTLGTNNSAAIALGDIDGNGSLDMVVANNGQANRVYLNDGSGSFTDSAQALDANNSTAIALADIDGDFDVDLIVANNGAANRVYLNDGSGSFTDSAQTLGSSNSTAIALADVDGNSSLDLAIANNAQANRLYINSWTNTAPVPGNSGALATPTAFNQVTLSWTAASDDFTPAAELQYAVYSHASSLSGMTPDWIEANATLQMAYAANTTSAPPLTRSAYHLAVIVKDGDGKHSLYALSAPADYNCEPDYHGIYCEERIRATRPTYSPPYGLIIPYEVAISAGEAVRNCATTFGSYVALLGSTPSCVMKAGDDPYRFSVMIILLGSTSPLLFTDATLNVEIKLITDPTETVTVSIPGKLAP